MKSIIIISFIIVILICFIVFRNNYENFDYKKINLNKIENENLLTVLNKFKNNLDYLNDKIKNQELKLNKIY
tara:strand:- start:3390 stop:3605 length:216 start_codon:yes stop_codon:yes gene_type:complete